MPKSGDPLIDGGWLVVGLRSAMEWGGRHLEEIPARIVEIIRDDVWRAFNVVKPLGGNTLRTFERFEQFVADADGLATDLRTLMNLCRDHPEAESAIDSATQRPDGGANNPHGRKGKPRGEITVHNINGDSRRPWGTSRQHAERKLARDAPALHARVLAGELSAHAAMLAAGYRRPTFTVPADPERIARALVRRLGRDGARAVSARIGAILAEADDEEAMTGRALAIVQRHAFVECIKADIPFDVFWREMHYDALVPRVRALLTRHALCQCCGMLFGRENTVTLGHYEPPRALYEWSAHHVWIACRACHMQRGQTPWDEWLTQGWQSDEVRRARARTADDEGAR
jgi:hypothetical protein